MPTIINPNAILYGYDIEFHTVGFVKAHFQLDISPADQNQLGYPQPQFIPKSKNGTVFYNIPDLLGFDVPVLIKTKKEYKGTIVILGQDALRDPNDPLLSGFNTQNDIAVGLPYAIAFDQNYKQVSVYHNLIKDILDTGYDVYLTDIWKSWNEKGNSRMQTSGWGVGNPHKTCLDNEFQELNIDFILLMGGVAQEKFPTISCLGHIIDISVPHLSPMANKKWAKLVGKPVTGIKKIKFIKDEMRKNGVLI